MSTKTKHRRDSTEVVGLPRPEWHPGTPMLRQILLNALTDHAHTVVVCEKDGATSRLARLDTAQIARWKEFGSLGTLWLSGRIGGTRW